MGLGSLMDACVPRFGVKEGDGQEEDCVIDVGSQDLTDESSEAEDDSFLWQSSQGSEAVSGGRVCFPVALILGRSP